MQKNALYTIGHGSRKGEDFISLLKTFEIEYLVDVRSLPYSRFHPQFNQKALQLALQENSIQYIFMGDELGGRPKDPSCYNEDGKVNYSVIKTKVFFQRGVERLKAACEKNSRVAIMCSERKPCHCHRTLLVGEVLHKEMIVLKHIDEHGKLKEHSTVMNELRSKFKQTDLFG